MARSLRTLVALSLALSALLSPLHADTAPPSSTQRPPTARSPLTELDKYVHALDPAYRWKREQAVRGEGYTVSAIDMVSQNWLTPAEVDHPEWRHWIFVVRPDDVQSGTGLLFISGGRNRDGKMPKPNAQLGEIAKRTRSVVAELRMAPNQPLVFHGDGVGRFEDDLIAYGWDRFLKGEGAEWLARLPMTKAAVRAMDTITAFTASEEGGGRAVDRFVVAGASKRGWTTWTTAATDARVVGICPIVIDVLNVHESMLHHYQAYGFWAPAVGDYVTHGIMDRLDQPELRELLRISDPYSYRDRLRMPKLILNACGDQFFLPDSSQFYFDGLKGTKYLRYVPNADHSLKDSDAYDTLLAWHDSLIHGRKLPDFDWSHRGEGEIRVRAKDRPVEVRLWQATNTDARDFRLETLGPKWTSSVLTAGGSGRYEGRVETPARGWTAYMVELTYDVGAPTKLKLTTDVKVIPESLPHPRPGK